MWLFTDFCNLKLQLRTYIRALMITDQLLKTVTHKMAFISRYRQLMIHHFQTRKWLSTAFCHKMEITLVTYLLESITYDFLAWFGHSWVTYYWVKAYNKHSLEKVIYWIFAHCLPAHKSQITEAKNFVILKSCSLIFSLLVPVISKVRLT